MFVAEFMFFYFTCVDGFTKKLNFNKTTLKQLQKTAGKTITKWLPRANYCMQ